MEKAEDGSPDIPITISSQKVDLNNQKREALYYGDVKVTRADMTLTADTLKVLFRETDQGIHVIHARGHVKIWWKDRYAEAEEGIYDEHAQTILLTGFPKTWYDENMVRGESITYDLKEDKVVVEGGVETIIQVEPGSVGKAP
ncbi:MAG: lipopolysaccharide transport periplasmic protein LptA [bacterium]